MRAILSAGMMLAIGCSSEAPFLSSDVSTRDMLLNVTVDGDAARTRITVSLTGPGSNVYLTGGDRLVVREGSQPIAMRPEGKYGYTADLPAGAVDLTIQLVRAAPDDSVDITLPMPPATAITTVPTASRAAPLDITWDPDDGPQATTLALSGACIPTITRPLTVDVGHYTIQPADVAGSPDTCAVEITLTRAVEQQTNGSPLQHSTVTLTQVAKTVLQSTP